MNKKTIVGALSAFLLALPLVSLAFVPDQIPNNIPINILGIINGVFGILWPAVVAGIIIMFIIAGFNFLTANGDAGKIKSAQHSVIWGVVGVVVILLAFSIITIVRVAIGGGAL